MGQKGSRWHGPPHGTIEAGRICSSLLAALSSAGAALASACSRIREKTKKDLISFSQSLTLLHFAKCNLDTFEIQSWKAQATQRTRPLGTMVNGTFKKLRTIAAKNLLP